MPGSPTPNYGIPTFLGTDLVRDLDTQANAAFTTIDSKMVGYSQGPLGSRPTSTPGTPGIAGRRYRATDTGQEFVDTGTSWVEVATSQVEAWRVVQAAGQPAPSFYFGGVTADSSRPVAFYKDPLGVVRIKGRVNSIGGGEQGLFQLPAGFRPTDHSRLFSCYRGDLGTNGSREVEIQVDGDVVALNGTAGAIGLDAIAFRI